MINSKKKWRKSEENTLYNRVNEYLQQGKDLDEAFEAVAKEIGRTERGCRDRWNQLYKRKLKPKSEEPTYMDHRVLLESLQALVEENEQLKKRLTRYEEIAKQLRELA